MRHDGPALAGLLVLLAATAQTAPIVLSVSPAIVSMEVQRGKTQEIDVTVGNLGDSDLEMHAAAMDLALTPTGAAMPVKASNSAHSCASWLSLTPESFVLAPGQTQVVQATLRPPMNARGGAYGVIAIRAKTQARAGAGATRVEVVGTTGTVLMLTVKGPGRVRGSLGSGRARVTQRADGPQVAFSLEVRNQGDVHLRCSGAVTVFSPAGRVVGRANLQAGTGTVLPGGVRRLTALWRPRKTPPGAYTAIARVVIPRHRTLRTAIPVELR